MLISWSLMTVSLKRQLECFLLFFNPFFKAEKRTLQGDYNSLWMDIFFSCLLIPPFNPDVLSVTAMIRQQKV